MAANIYPVRHGLFSRQQKGGIYLIANEEMTTGSIFWVDSVTGSDAGGFGVNPDRPFASINYASTQCTPNSGDTIHAMPGHVENVNLAGALTFAVAGIKIKAHGCGDSRAQINFNSVVGADMNVNATCITMDGFHFVAAIDALTGPIDVNASTFTLLNSHYIDGTGIDTTDCIVADANADDMIIDGWYYREGDAAGTQKESNIQIAGATRPVLRNINIKGDFDTGCIENGTAWVDATLDDIVLNNTAPGPVVGIALQATSTGSARNVDVRVDSGTTFITANNDMQWFNCRGVGVDADADIPIGVAPTGGIEDTVDTIAGQTVAMERTVIKADGNVLNGQDPIFNVAGGPVMVREFVGIVTTIIGGAANMHIDYASTTPGGADVPLSTNVAIDNDAAGTSYTFTAAAPSVLTPVTAGTVDQAPDTKWLLPIGQMLASGSAAQTGVIAWHISYVPLSPLSVVTAAA